MNWHKAVNLDEVMIMFNRNNLVIFLLLVFSNPLLAKEPISPACRPIHVEAGAYPGPHQFSQGLLWRVEKQGAMPSHIFGTIHVSNEAILSHLDAIEPMLTASEVFLMEALPDPEQMFLMEQMMFFNDDTRLDDVVPPGIFSRAVDILEAYHLNRQVVSIMKPWAAYITMSYPVDMGAVLDLVLLQQAQQAGLEVAGLETLQEQGELFNQLAMGEQRQLLTDAVCHYDLIEDDFDKMIALYMQKDLAGLYAYGQRYGFADNALYEALMDTILTKRNYTMVERMQPALEEGAAFVAVGALHLPGMEGVLALLEKQGYEITKVY